MLEQLANLLPRIPLCFMISFPHNWCLTYLFTPAVWVDIVSKVVTPSDTLAGTDLESSQKETQDTITNMQDGT